MTEDEYAVFAEAVAALSGALHFIHSQVCAKRALTVHPFSGTLNPGAVHYCEWCKGPWSQLAAANDALKAHEAREQP